MIAGLRSAHTRPAEALFSLIEWVPLDESVARRAGELGRRFHPRHRGIDAADLAVAGTAEHLGAALATSNLKRFPMYPGLEAPY